MQLSARTPSLTLHRQFRQPRLLIVGCGDIGLRVAAQLHERWRLRATTSQADRVQPLRALGITALLANLDQPRSLKRLAGLAPHVLHLAPPSSSTPGRTDHRTRNLLRALAHQRTLVRVVYGSTSGVYGDALGQQVTETRAVAPVTARGLRRVDAEQRLRRWARGSGSPQTRPARQALVLRIPGIYALDRAGGNPRERLLRGTPVLQPADDVYTNHIHADDLARACIAALHRGGNVRTFNVCDDSQLLMGDYFDLAAQLASLPKPPRISREQAVQRLSPMQMSFLSESRRLVNHRLKQELRLQLRYPTVHQGLAGLATNP
jgi:nucleoside-diphosphate-sugar epimerase